MKQLKKQLEQKDSKKILKTKQYTSFLANDEIELNKLTLKMKKNIKAPVLEITLSHKKKVICTFTVDYDQFTTTQLVESALSIFRKKHPQTSFLGVECGNNELDYYLSCPKKSLYLFKKGLVLTPFIQSNQKGINKYKFLKVIGVGGFSKVYLARSKRDGKFYAVKLLQKKKVIQKRKTCILMNQKNILSSIDHPFILKLYETFQTHLFFAFVLEYCPGGELFFTLTQCKKFTETQIRFYSVQILEAICYLHKKDILYRDLKPQNILFDMDGHLKLIDFGISRQNVTKDTVCTSFCGSPPYMAPQIVMKQGHSFPVDFYCIGALLYQLATGYPPFEGQNQKQVYDDIVNKQIQYPEQLSKNFKNLLKGLLHKNPKQRFGSKGGIDQILNHKFYQNINVNDILNKKSTPPLIPHISSLNVYVQNVVTQFIELQKKLNIQLELECNLYQKTLPSFQYSNFNRKVSDLNVQKKNSIRKQIFQFSLEKYKKVQDNNYFDKDNFFDKDISQARRRKKLRQRLKSIRKDGNKQSKDISKNKNDIDSLNRYNSLKTINQANKIKKVSKTKKPSLVGNSIQKVKKDEYYQDYFEIKKSKKGINDSSKGKPKELVHQFSMTNISSRVYFS